MRGLGYKFEVVSSDEISAELVHLVDHYSTEKSHLHHLNIITIRQNTIILSPLIIHGKSNSEPMPNYARTPKRCWPQSRSNFKTD